jgi:cyclopropane fatty-acyl-phospholipid synthase-like methyltransferase
MFGLEINSKRVNLAQKIFSSFSNLSFKTTNLLSIQKKSFDSILAIDLFHHLNLSQKNQFLDDSFQKLKNNGTLIIKDINTKPLLKYLWNYFHDLVMTKFSSLHFLSVSNMEKILKQHHFKVIKKGIYKNFLYPHVFYVCQKNS